MGRLSRISRLGRIERLGGGAAAEADPIGDALRADLLAYYTLEDVTDSGPNGLDLTNVNSTAFVAGKVGNAADFERDSGQSLNHAHNAAFEIGSSDYTIGCWVWVESMPGDSGAVVLKDGSGLGTQRSWQCAVNNAGAVLFLCNPSAASGFVTCTGDTIGTGAWHWLLFDHINGASIGVRVDNGTRASLAFTTGVYESGVSLMVGGHWFDATYGHDGKTDELFFIRRLLTSDERDYLYNSGNGRSLYP